MNSELDKVDLGEGFSSLDLIGQCLIDEDKFYGFEKALKKVISKESNVLELGTGSGILSLLCARLGAGEVTAVEFDPYISKIASENIKNNGYEKTINVVQGDARTVSFPDKKFNVVVMEMLATGLVDEMQVLAMNNLHTNGVLTKDVKVFPYAQENYISLATTDFNLYGFNMRMIRHLWSHDKNDSIFNEVSERVLVNNVVFTEINEEFFTADIDLVSNIDAKINSLCLTSRVIVDSEKEVILDSTHSLSPIVLIPVEEKEVKKGDTLRMRISYHFGGGFENFNVRFI